MARPVVLVVGGGFAGVEAARTLARSKAADVLLVDVANFTLFTPMLPEVATGDIESRHILVPHRDVLPPRYYRQGRVLEFDAEARTAVVETKLMPRRDEVHFDHAIFSPGGVTNFFGVPGAEEHALTFKTIGDAISLRNRIIGLLERASVETSSEGRAGLCGVVIVGAGYSGVELAASLADFFNGTRRQYPELADYLRVTVVEMGDRVAHMLPERLQAVCRRKLERAGVDLRLRTRVEEVTADSVTVSPGGTLPAITTVWSAGIKPTGRGGGAHGTERPGSAHRTARGPAGSPRRGEHPRQARREAPRSVHVQDTGRARIARTPERRGHRDGAHGAWIPRLVAVAELLLDEAPDVASPCASRGGLDDRPLLPEGHRSATGQGRA
jgi:NADH dehydrogenase FAD-containing subunit